MNVIEQIFVNVIVNLPVRHNYLNIRSISQHIESSLYPHPRGYPTHEQNIRNPIFTVVFLLSKVVNLLQPDKTT